MKKNSQKQETHTLASSAKRIVAIYRKDQGRERPAKQGVGKNLEVGSIANLPSEKKKAPREETASIKKKKRETSRAISFKRM